LRKGLVEAGTGNLLLVGQHGTVLRSTDGGLLWHALPSGTRRNFRGATVDTRSGNIVAVGDRIVRLVRVSDAPSRGEE
jgi:photosystem II stability/assembly factor-like uncharacterized protein